MHASALIVLLAGFAALVPPVAAPDSPARLAPAADVVLQEQGSAASLPGKARDALEERWRGWQLAPVEPDVVSCASGGGAGPIALDVDGDRQPDFALAVLAGQDVRLVALISRPWGYDLYDIDSLGQGSASAYLSVLAAGSAYLNPRTASSDYLPHDTIGAFRCGEPGRTVYIWRGFRFEKVAVVEA